MSRSRHPLETSGRPGQAGAPGCTWCGGTHDFRRAAWRRTAAGLWRMAAFAMARGGAPMIAGGEDGWNEFCPRVAQCADAAGYLKSVSHDSTLTGSGTVSSPLSVVPGGGGGGGFGAPQPRANGVGYAQASATSVTIQYGADAQLGGDGLIFAVNAGVSTTPVGVGATLIAGPHQIGGASVWVSIFASMPPAAVPSTFSCAGTSFIGVNAYAIAPGARGSIAVDQHVQDASPTKHPGVVDFGAAGFTPTQKPSLILYFLSPSSTTTFIMLDPGIVAGAAIGSPTYQAISSFLPFAITSYSVGTASQAIAFYSNSLVAINPTIRVPIISTSSSYDMLLQGLNVY